MIYKMIYRKSLSLDLTGSHYEIELHIMSFVCYASGVVVERT